ncbi:C-C motif chemokine 5-like [Entelurus aequoreus]|uniref:C-C motif chemokine 5-like n=1 Tax=Entelurus aequoreus TaxID=161455 RepID=UPI002B1D8CD2|nr:C-C motif chemokine 5-like [Entelurus aequoreus]
MKFQTLLSLLLIICTTLCVAQESAVAASSEFDPQENAHPQDSYQTFDGSYGNCCLGHVRRMRANAIVNIESYRIQETDGDCNIRAVVFTMMRTPGRKNQRTVCADPDKKWVKKLKEAVDAREKISRR